MINKKAFTLVELVVIIVILSILSVIAFLNYKSYPQSSRDAVRNSDLTNVRKQMDVYYIKNGMYPAGNGVGKEIPTMTGWVEKDFDKKLASQIGISEVKDPLTKKTYKYFVAKDRSGYFIESIKEETGEKIKIGAGPRNCNDIRTVRHFAEMDFPNGEYIVFPDGNLEAKTVTCSGETQEEEYVDPFKCPGEKPYLKEFSNSTTGYSFKRVKKTWPDDNCKVNDLEIYDSSGILLQTWAGCNSTFGDGKDWSDITNIDTCYDYNTNSDISKCEVSNSKMLSNKNARDYFLEVQPTCKNSDGDSEFSTIWGKFYTFNNANTACPSGWHVPSYSEFYVLVESVGCMNHATSASGQCVGYGWGGHSSKEEWENVANLLILPLSGRYVNSSKSYRGYGSYLWSSHGHNSVQFWEGYSIIRFSGNNTGPVYGYNVRCIKD